MPRHASLRDEDGFTLVELLVAAIIMGVLTSATLGTLLTVQRAVVRNENRNGDLSAARTAMDAAKKPLRTAVVLPGGTLTTPFESFTATDVTFYSYANSDPAAGPKKVRLWVTPDGVLSEAVTDPDVRPAGAPTWTYPATPTRTRVLSRGVANTTAVFSAYCSRTSPEATCAATGQPATAAVAVGVHLSVRQPGEPVAATDLVGRVRLTNLDLH